MYVKALHLNPIRKYYMRQWELLTSQEGGGENGNFVEYTAPDSRQLEKLFTQIGFTAIAKHRFKDVVLYRQGNINFIINHELDSFAQAFAVPVKNVAACYEGCIKLGAKPHNTNVAPLEINIPAIMDIGNSLIYLIDRYGDYSIYDIVK